MATAIAVSEQFAILIIIGNFTQYCLGALKKRKKNLTKTPYSGGITPSDLWWHVLRDLDSELIPAGRASVSQS